MKNTINTVNSLYEFTYDIVHLVNVIKYVPILIPL